MTAERPTLLHPETDRHDLTEPRAKLPRGTFDKPNSKPNASGFLFFSSLLERDGVMRSRLGIERTR